MIKKNLFQVNGQIGRTATFVSTDDEIALDISTLHRSHSKTPKLSLEVLYEDDYLAVINKPAGILVSGNKFVTVANALSQNLSYSNQIENIQADCLLLAKGKVDKMILYAILGLDK